MEIYRFIQNFQIMKKLNMESQNKYLVIWGTNLGYSVRSVRFSKQERDMMKLPPFHFSVIVGLILSDACLRFPSLTSKNVRLEFDQALSHAQYLWFVFFILAPYCSSYPSILNRTLNGTKFSSLRFLTRSLLCFTELYSLFYPNKVKVIPDNIYELLTPVALAHMIMGDGSYVGKGIVLCTDSYSIKGVICLMNVLIIRYDLKCTLHENKGKYRIYISRNSMEKVIRVVKPHMAPSMYNKLGL
jgi:hypothetical protein